MVRYEGNGGGQELGRERKDVRKEERSQKREERHKNKRITKQMPAKFWFVVSTDRTPLLHLQFPHCILYINK
jgi:iron only hydrogenase large subunit-like protein